MKIIIFLWSFLIMSNYAAAKSEQAVFAGGCFWCLEADFDKVPGVLKTVSGFDGGKGEKPSYAQVSSGETDYIESVQVTFDPSIISYEQLLDHFWRHVDPTDSDGQFCDKGYQYTTALFFIDEKQKRIAETSLEKIKSLFAKAGLRIQTQILPSTNFTPADKGHQNYYRENPVRYKYYRWNCGRDKRTQELKEKVWDVYN